MSKAEIRKQRLTGERAQFGARDMACYDCVFADGESPLKESCGIECYNTSFEWKYPLWYAKDVFVKDGTWREMARAGVWYTQNMTVEKAYIEAPKNFRRCTNLTLKDVEFTNAQETLWQCDNVTIKDCKAKGDYLAMNSSNITIENLELDGNYPFDGCKNITVRNCKLMSKDAFWNCENVEVYDTYICGEYLAWNSKNVTFVNCVIESEQGLCYIDNLVMKNCKLPNTFLAFEYVTVDAQIDGNITSIINPTSGVIKADSVETLIMDPNRVDVRKTQIIANIEKKLDVSPDEEVRTPIE